MTSQTTRQPRKLAWSLFVCFKAAPLTQINRERFTQFKLLRGNENMKTVETLSGRAVT